MHSSCIISLSCAIRSSPRIAWGNSPRCSVKSRAMSSAIPTARRSRPSTRSRTSTRRDGPRKTRISSPTTHWHTDKAYLPVPALLTMLHAIELPPKGGDTQFADMTSAYVALSDDDKRRIADLSRRAQPRVHARVDGRSPADRRRAGSRAAGDASVGPHAPANRREELVPRHVLLAHRRHGAAAKAARCSIGSLRTRRSRASSIRTAGGPATSSSGTTAASCIARWRTTTWGRAAGCCSAWWSGVTPHLDGAHGRRDGRRPLRPPVTTIRL